jgi:hypothetical protein
MKKSDENLVQTPFNFIELGGRNQSFENVFEVIGKLFLTCGFWARYAPMLVSLIEISNFQYEYTKTGSVGCLPVELPKDIYLCDVISVRH